MEPIDNADKKTFWQWLAGKGPFYVAVDVFITLFYIVCIVGGIIAIINKTMGTIELVLLFGVPTVMYIVTALKTLQNYHDDQQGITR